MVRLPSPRLSSSTSDRMKITLSFIIALAFVTLSLWHFGMALSPAGSMSSAVPSESGKPLLMPSTKATVAVGGVLLLFGLLVAGTAGLIQVGLSQQMLSWSSYALALGLLARAVGEFKYVGFFKRVRGTRFARLDTLVYSPLCLLLAVGVALVAS